MERILNNFDNVIDHLIINEGGYVNHFADKGGSTIYGVTLKNWLAHLKKYKFHDFYLDSRWFSFITEGKDGISFFNVNKFSLNDFKALKPSDIKFFYYKEYWEPLSCDDLPNAVDYYVFDFGVNSGVSRSAKFLQRIVGAVPDGVIGDKTVTATLAYCNLHGVKRLLKELNKDRLDFLSNLKNSPFFLKGWKSRLNKVMAKCYEMLNDLYIDQTKPLTESRTIKTASKEAKIATGLLVAGAVAPPEQAITQNLQFVVGNVQTVQTLTQAIHNLYQYGWAIPLILMLGFAGYYTYLRRDDWFKGKE